MNSSIILDYQINPSLIFDNHQGFPKQALIDAIENKEQSTDLLLEHLEYAYTNHEEFAAKPNPNYNGAIHAAYLLAQFREQRAFPILLKIFSLPSKTLRVFYGDYLNYMDSILASVYNGDFQSLADFIENPNHDQLARGCALRSIFILVRENLLQRPFVLNYFESLWTLFRGIQKLETNTNWISLQLLLTQFLFNITEFKPTINENGQQQSVDPVSSQKSVDQFLVEHPIFNKLKIISNAIEELYTSFSLYEFSLNANSPLGKLFFYNSDRTFPEIEILEAIKNKENSTDILLQHLEYVYNNCEQLTIDADYYGLHHTSYILAHFREQRAFPLFLKLFALPSDTIHSLYGDATMAYGLHRFLAATYNGDFEALARLIQNTLADEFPRSAGLRSLVIMVDEEMIDRNFVIAYMKSLFDSGIEKNNPFLQSTLVFAAALIKAKELLPQINNAFNQKLIDPTLTNKPEIDNLLKNYPYPTKLAVPHYMLISDVIQEMRNLPIYSKSTDCDNKEPEYAQEDQNAEHKYHEDADSLPYQKPWHSPHINTSSKIGRNDPCSCGSEKKFKKCCLV